MMSEEQRVAAFLLALRESEKRHPHGTSGGYVDHLQASGDEAGITKAATIDGWWTVEQLTHALQAATSTPAPRRWLNDPRWWDGALAAALIIWVGNLLWGVLT